MAQHVLITAGASGIGYALAKGFAATGAHIWVVDADQAALDACPADWQRDAVDVGDPDAMAALFTKIAQTWPRLDVLCANAGIAGQTALLEDQDITAFRDCVRVNLEGAFLACKGALPMMKGIRANVIAPGAVEGPRMDGVIAREAAAKGMSEQAIREGYASGTSLKTFVEASDIADMAVFLASDAAKRVSGQTIAVDGHTENPDPKP